MKKEHALAALPSDVRHWLRHQARWLTIITILWYILWGVSIAQYYVRHPEAQVHYTLPLFAGALLILPLWIFRFRVVLFDRPFEGEIVKIKYRMMSDVPIFSEGLERVERHETAILHVRRANGKVKKLACRRLWRAADRCYRVGDRVQHIPFLPLPKNLSHEPEGERLCHVCGTLSDRHGERCIECGHTIF